MIATCSLLWIEFALISAFSLLISKQNGQEWIIPIIEAMFVVFHANQNVCWKCKYLCFPAGPFEVLFVLLSPSCSLGWSLEQGNDLLKNQNQVVFGMEKKSGEG